MPDFRINNMLLPGGKRKALTLSYDDGVIQDRRLTEMLDRYGIRATFNLNSAFLGRVERAVMEGVDTDISTVLPEEVGTLYKNHEVSTHGSRHSSPVDSGSSFLREVMDDREALEALVPYMVTGHAYPFGLTDEKVIAMLRAAGIAYARTVISTHSFDLPGNFLRWDPTCHHDDPRLMELAEEFCTHQARFGRPELFYLWGHSYEFDIHGNWERMESFLAYVSGYRDSIWMATNGEICGYLSAWDRLVFSADGKRAYNPTAAELWIDASGRICRIPSGGIAEIA